MNVTDFRKVMQAQGFSEEQIEALISKSGRVFDNIGFTPTEAQEKFRAELSFFYTSTCVGATYEKLMGAK